MTNDSIEQMRLLVERLNEASEAYYNGQGELMTDHEWDALFDRLGEMERETGVVLDDSPTHNVSADSISGRKERHEYPALSLAKTKLVSELVKWAEGRPVWVSWKLDGLTLVVTYDNGRLTKIVTRGNGHEGTNITHMATAIEGIPLTLTYKGHLVIRGEAVISYADFQKFLMETDEDYANPRNLASGSLALRDSSEVAKRHIRWIPFSLVYTDSDQTEWGDRMDSLAHMGMTPVERERIDTPDIDTMNTVINKWTEKVTNGENPFPVDGLVITYNDTVFAASGSVTGHHATRGGLAFKWQDEEAQTTLDRVEWSCAASKISPVAVFEPVELEGTIVRRASLCNISECERLGIGGTGTSITVIKANKIIPKVVRVDAKVGNLYIPDKCPVCGSPTVIYNSEGSETRTLHCTNSLCPAKQLKIFSRFVSKEGMNIDGLSEATLAKFVNRGWITEFADIYQLRSHIREIANMEGFGEVSASKIMRAIDKSRKVEAVRLLYAMCIPMCGIDVCKRLLEAYKLDILIEEASMRSDSAFFSHIPGIGPEKSASVVNWFHDEGNRKKVERLLEQVEVNQPEMKSKGGKCQGLTFVITGDVHYYRNRAQLKTYIEEQGGKVTGSVSKSTTWLINNDATSTSGKNRKAQELGIGIMTEKEFIDKYNPDMRINDTPDLFA